MGKVYPMVKVNTLLKIVVVVQVFLPLVTQTVVVTHRHIPHGTGLDLKLQGIHDEEWMFCIVDFQLTVYQVCARSLNAAFNKMQLCSFLFTCRHTCGCYFMPMNVCSPCTPIYPRCPNVQVFTEFLACINTLLPCKYTHQSSS